MGALGLQVVLIAIAFAWVAVYSYLIAPGQTLDAYRLYAERSGPWISLLCGAPLFFLASLRVGGRDREGAIATALALFGIYLAIDAPILLLTHNPFAPVWLIAFNYGLKVLACGLGGWTAVRLLAR